MPLISVVMSVYNGERYVGEAVDSVLSQSRTDFELIVVDDGSTDGTAAILASYTDPRLRVIRHDNQGLTRSLNLAVAQARGKYVARQDADDRSLPERLAIQTDFLDAHPEIALVGSAVKVISSQGVELATFRHPTEPAEIAATLRSYNCFWHGSIMFRRDSFLELGGYDERFVTAQDYDMWLRFSERHQLANLPEPLYAYRFTVESVTVQRMVSQHRLAVLARRLAEEREGGSPDTVQDVASYIALPLSLAERRQIINNYKPWCRLLIKNGLTREAAILMAALFKHHPRPLFRLSFALARLVNTPSVLTRFLEHA
ncbi:glycosyltransferase family 2 protein [Geomonas azotofigens]|uniref:glycosyltransferase family 2 protein n=1 Tax=Geomonas azotofigens TaxID=2843196 RepID=UPI001C0F798E|nr:glycosyltransferase [Geomonas azotofigens]MBU5614581.1 glycosyltransferase [Geomonas azotofigens]